MWNLDRFKDLQDLHFLCYFNVMVVLKKQDLIRSEGDTN